MRTINDTINQLNALARLVILVILEGKIKGRKPKGRSKRMWFDDVRQWTMLKDYGEVKRSAEDRVAWRAITRQPST